MGNKQLTSRETPEQQNIIPFEERLSKVHSVPVLLTHNEWLAKVKEQRALYHRQLDDDKDALLDDYQLFIDYLIFRRNITGYSEICVIARIVRYFVGAVHGISLFDDTAITFDGLRIAIAVHPITARIYIADEKRIYKLLSPGQNGVSSRFSSVAEIPAHHQSAHKIKDVTFSADGNDMFCLMNNDMSNVYRVKISDENISIYERICYEAPHGAMDFLLYDFNHCFFGSSFFFNLLHVTYESSLLSSGIHYTLDAYKRHVWLVCHHENRSLQHFLADGRALNLKPPFLVRISAAYVTIVRKLQIFNEELSRVSKSAMSDAGDDAYEQKLQSLEVQRNALREELKSRAKECALISLHALIVDEKEEQEDPQKRIRFLQVDTFDVDKLHFAVYFITKHKMFVRIERKKNFNAEDIKFMSPRSVNETKIWRTTHILSLKGDVLPNRYPLGFCNVRYDSISGKILIADNYKMQALCM